jgi:hypothetical protein
VTKKQTLELSIALTLGVVLLAGIVLLVRWRSRKLVSLQGAIAVQDSDVRKELPISGVEISAIQASSTEQTKSDPSGFFLIKLPKGARRGQPITLQFRHANYRPLDLHEFTGDKLYIIHMVPLSASTSNSPATKIGNVSVRYSVKTQAETNIGSQVATFQVVNKGNVPCKNHYPCSPDGKWKANIGSTTLDAGVGNQFRDVRVSCIAGPCPFTRVESGPAARSGQVISITARAWSDTVTFLVEAEVLHSMPTEITHEFYPVIFGKGLSFTLPAAVEGVTIQADVGDQNVFFPLGPSLFLSWANCNASVNPDQTKVYRCELKPGYRFQ